MFEYRAVVNRIVDGDTTDLDIDLGFGIWQHKVRIRLQGVDTPECRTRDLTEKVYGLMAKDFVIANIPVGSEVTVQTSLDKKGKFGRILGVIMYDNGTKNLNEDLINGHLAVRYEGQSKALIEEAHILNRTFLTAQPKNA